MKTIIQTKNLTKGYNLGDQVLFAMDDISLEVYSGEMLAVLGETSSGKSTLLHTLACLQRPDSGSLDFEGQDVAHLSDAALVKLRTHRMGFIFQAFNTLPNGNLLANVEVPLRAQGTASLDSRERAEEALRSVGLGNALEYWPGQLTAGQRLCVSIARAQVHRPAVIFADEPTQEIDSSSGEEILGLLQRLNDEGKTVVIATEDADVARHCHRVVKMVNGRVEAIAPVESRTIVPADRIPGGAVKASDRVVLVCTRCDYGNFEDQQVCSVCAFPLDLTENEEKAVERRLSRADSGAVGVESRSDEGQVLVPDLIKNLKEVPFFSGLGSKNLIKVIPSLQSLSHRPAIWFGVLLAAILEWEVPGRRLSRGSSEYSSLCARLLSSTGPWPSPEAPGHFATASAGCGSSPPGTTHSGQRPTPVS